MSRKELIEKVKYIHCRAHTVQLRIRIPLCSQILIDHNDYVLLACLSKNSTGPSVHPNDAPIRCLEMAETARAIHRPSQLRQRRYNNCPRPAGTTRTIEVCRRWRHHNRVRIGQIVIVHAGVAVDKVTARPVSTIAGDPILLAAFSFVLILSAGLPHLLQFN